MFWGGLAQAVRRVARFISKTGCDVHVANLHTVQEGLGLLDENDGSTTEEGVTVHRIPIGRERDLLEDNLWDSPVTLSIRHMYHCLERLHQRYHFDVFHPFFVYPMGYVAAVLARVYQKKLILSIRGNDINQYVFGPDKATTLQIALRQADLITSVSHDLLAKADTLTPIMEKSRVIFNSIPPCERGSPSVVLPELEGSVIGTVGLFKHSKGLPYLLKAFHDIRKVRRSSLLLVGDIREGERVIHNRYMSRFNSRAIHITGPVPHESIDSFLRRMDVLVIPSLSEGCPNVLLEGMAAARPIVATKTGAIPEIIQDRESGLLVDPGDAFQIREAVLHVLDHPDEAAAMGRKALEATRIFSEERERGQWEEVYAVISDSLLSAARAEKGGDD
jgi:glycosyltransferase involved in cell wall biosynthesis